MKRKRVYHGPTVVNVKSGIGLKTIILIILLVGVIGYLGIALVGNCGLFKSKPPNFDKAPWMISTVDRYYYVLRYQEDNRFIVLYDFWEKVGEKWIHREIPLPLEKDSFQKPIKIERRKAEE